MMNINIVYLMKIILTQIVDGKKASAKRKVLIFHSKKEALRAEKKRNEKINKAERYIKSWAYKLDYSYKKYVKVVPIDNNTGEVKSDIAASIDYDKINNEKMFDGYFCIITSELDFTEEMIRTKYHGLWRIEESFKITKSTLNTQYF